jgi:hypothetical protein
MFLLFLILFYFILIGVKLISFFGVVSLGACPEERGSGEGPWAEGGGAAGASDRHLRQKSDQGVHRHGERVDRTPQSSFFCSPFASPRRRTLCLTHYPIQDLVARYKTVGPEVIHEAAVTAAISDFKSTNSVHYLSMVRVLGLFPASSLPKWKLNQR